MVTMKRAILPVVVGALLLGTSGCASSSGPEADSSSQGVAEEVATSTTTLLATPLPVGFDSITTPDGRVRTYRVVDTSNGDPAPLLFVLHGFGGTAEQMAGYTGVEQALEDVYDLGAIVVYPNGTGSEEGLPQSWNAGNCCPFAIYEPVDDVAFFDQLITELISRFDVDTQRIWVMGHSNGGMMAYRLACELSTRVTAIGVAAGALMIESCSPSRPTSAFHVHGELDMVVPLNGGVTAGLEFPSATQSFERFAIANACTISGGTATCSAGNTVQLVTDASWPHDWQPEWTSLILNFLTAKLRE